MRVSMTRQVCGKEVKMARKQYIKIRGANEHNLKNLSVDIPRNELVVLTGLSGSGKSLSLIHIYRLLPDLPAALRTVGNTDSGIE